MERVGEVWSYPQAKATSNAALAARVVELERENTALRLTGAVVYPPDGTVSPFTVIHLGHGQVRLGDCVHDNRLPGLWVGRDGLGMGVSQAMNRHANSDETLAVITFANVEGLDVLFDAVQRIRNIAFPGAAQMGCERDAAMLDLRDFKESQWWFKELDEAVAHGSDDQKRAVGVVRHMLHVAAIVTQQGAQP